MTKLQAKNEIARIVKHELPKVKTHITNKRVGAGYLIDKVTPADRYLSKKLSIRIATLMSIIYS